MFETLLAALVLMVSLQVLGLVKLADWLSDQQAAPKGDRGYSARSTEGYARAA